MAKVQITSQLNAKLAGTPLTPTLLMQQFSDWKAGDEYGSYWFSQPKTQNGLTHAHMAPVTPGKDKQLWDLYWTQRKEHRRRSDCYVLYAYDRTHGYLLIDVLFDPGAHRLWTQAAKSQLDAYETVADNFIFNGSVP